ncbi:MAG TPA: hypothetical protein VFE58_07265 [Tepidisphaeraceae bacterium]|nr:hypothetical protein [Tepidisphaeraceae bacterium]
MRIHRALFAIACSVGMLTAGANAAVITWNFDNVAGASTPTVFSAPASSGAAANLTAGSFNGVGGNTTSPGVYSGTVSNGYATATGVNCYGVYVAPAGGTGYYQVTFTPDTGYDFTLSDLDFGTRSTSTGPLNYAIQWSVDNYASNIYSAAISNAGSTWKFYDSSFSPVTDPISEPVTVRIFLSGGAGGAGSAANSRIDDVAFNVSAALPVPEPASAGLLASAALLLHRRRKA